MIKFRRALFSGTIAAIVVDVMLYANYWIVRLLGHSIYESMRVGELAIMPSLYWAGLAIGSVVGGATLGVVYALVFELVTRRAGWLIGAALGVVNAIGVWLGVGFLGWLFPDVANRFAIELSLLFNSLLVMVVLVAEHIIFGAILGTLYGATRHIPADERIVTWRELYPSDKSVQS
jgi:hypothetical protein